MTAETFRSGPPLGTVPWAMVKMTGFTAWMSRFPEIMAVVDAALVTIEFWGFSCPVPVSTVPPVKVSRPTMSL